MGGSLPDPDSLIALYGSLRSLAVRKRLGLAVWLRRAGPCRIGGLLYDLGDYPGLAPGDGIVRGELFEIRDQRALAAMDEFEDVVPGNPRVSLYLRERWRLIEPDVESWVYVYNSPVAGLPRVPGGDWLAARRR
jgi:gamma-glutamylcyclotransferase (GGCT)/AIG2-like uncharacterized protein YtfP